MEQLLKPPIFDVQPSDVNSGRLWNHWIRVFNNFLEELNKHEPQDQLKLLICHISASVFEYISECLTFEEAIATLKDIYDKPIGEVSARYKLLARRQRDGETHEQFIDSLKQLSECCNFKSVTATKNREDFIRDVFINGISSDLIRKHLLQNKTLSLHMAFNQAHKLESLETKKIGLSNSVILEKPENICEKYFEEHDSPLIFNGFVAENSSATSKKKCIYCGNDIHKSISQSPTIGAICYNCNVNGHSKKLCRKKLKKISVSTAVTDVSPFTPSTNRAIKIENTLRKYSGCATKTSDYFNDYINQLVPSNCMCSENEEGMCQKCNTTSQNKENGISVSNRSLLDEDDTNMVYEGFWDPIKQEFSVMSTENAEETNGKQTEDSYSISWEIIAKGTERGFPLLVSTEGYSYVISKKRKRSTDWVCSVRNKKIRCNARVNEKNGNFYPRHTHIHPIVHNWNGDSNNDPSGTEES